MISFSKAHACGNDFLIVTEEAAQGHNWADLTQRLCARNTGVGADGIEFFAWTGEKSGRIRLHNADGSVAEISGNGTRCVAAWMARERNLQAGDDLEIATDAGVRVCRINGVQSDGEFTVDVTTGMGVPTYVPRTVKLKSGIEISGVEISTGNPHFVIVLDIDEFEAGDMSWHEIGAEVCTHPDFPNQTNVEFVRIVSKHEIEIRIFERGVGPTTSSGTGSSASATAALAMHGCVSPLTVVAPGGAQSVAWDGPGTELRLTGPAALIARGEAW
ncbi:MAG TPA: diaminopimelate epimerase [Terracidiphilus sp.]|nr:diaminopimelate epimerase [Terracidiphilus sp.]